MLQNRKGSEIEGALRRRYADTTSLCQGHGLAGSACLFRSQRFCRREHVFGVDTKFFHHLWAGSAQPEPVKANYFAVQTDILIPRVGHARFDGNTPPTRCWQHFFAIFGWLAVKPLETRNRNYACAIAELLGRGHGVLQLTP